MSVNRVRRHQLRRRVRRAGWQAATSRGTTPLVRGAAAGLFLASLVVPRRLPDLRRFVESMDFRSLHGAAVGWTSHQFEQIETGAPWLAPVGRWVDDECTLSPCQDFDLRLAVQGVECTRQVTAVYGADGPLPGRLAELDAVLENCGWDEFFSYGAPSTARGDLAGQQPPVSAHWRAAPLPGGVEAVPPAGEHLARSLHVGWTSRNEPVDPKWTLDGRWYQGGSPVAEPPRPASRRCQPIEHRWADVGELTTAALASHQHAIAIGLLVTYYDNPDVRRFPVPRRLLPTPP